MAKDKVLEETQRGEMAMWCETCNRQTVSRHTMFRLYRSGYEVRIDNCTDCGNRQETEYIKGPTVRIKNKQ